MTRWHVLRRGRIVYTAWSSNADCAEREYPIVSGDLLVSDEDWRNIHWRRALRGRTNAHTPSALDLIRTARNATILAGIIRRRAKREAAQLNEV